VRHRLQESRGPAVVVKTAVIHDVSPARQQNVDRDRSPTYELAPLQHAPLPVKGRELHCCTMHYVMPTMALLGQLPVSSATTTTPAAATSPTTISPYRQAWLSRRFGTRRSILAMAVRYRGLVLGTSMKVAVVRIRTRSSASTTEHSVLSNLRPPCTRLAFAMSGPPLGCR
jgi:hypothetical protein